MEAVSMEQAIKIYLDNSAKTDSLFAETYRKANKSIKECCKYIYSQAKKLAKEGNAVGVDDAPSMDGQSITTTRMTSRLKM